MTDNDELTKEVHKRADANKRNLRHGNDVRVPTGDEDAPGERVDPFALRKAMFAKADRIRDEQAAEGGGLSEAQMELAERMRNEAGEEPVARTDATERTLHLPKKKVDKAENEYVSLTLNGNAISVAKGDVDRAGGAEMYLRRRELDEQALVLERQRTDIARRDQELQDSLAESQRLREELQRARNPASQGDGSANSGGDPSSQYRNDTGTGGMSDEELADELGTQIYAGSPEEASKAVLRLIRLQRARGDAVDVNAIAAKVKAEISPATPATTPVAAPAKPDPVVLMVNKQINAMANAEFTELMKNDEARAASWQRFLSLVKLPENRDRLAVDVARDACEQIEPLYDKGRAKVIERKRGLPNQAAAGGAEREATDETPLSTSEFIALQNDRRNFGRRAK